MVPCQASSLLTFNVLWWLGTLKSFQNSKLKLVLISETHLNIHHTRSCLTNNYESQIVPCANWNIPGVRRLLFKLGCREIGMPCNWAWRPTPSLSSGSPRWPPSSPPWSLDISRQAQLHGICGISIANRIPICTVNGAHLLVTSRENTSDPYVSLERSLTRSLTHSAFRSLWEKNKL